MRQLGRVRAAAAIGGLVGSALVLTGSVQAVTRPRNLLKNPSFEKKSVKSGFTSTNGPTTGPGPAAARGWQTFNYVKGMTTTDLLPTSLLPKRTPGKLMIHLVTSGIGNGLEEHFAAVDQGPKSAKFSVWVYVVQGAVEIGAANGNPKSSDVAAINTHPGKWVKLHGTKTAGPANTFFVFSDSSGVDDFYVDLASVTKAQ